ncbi:winged helix-turn-helix transcriptional regulator [Rosenbergiella collisarenosi]|uniref:winged helix-turn-helix transcriptional regulator n=1 Tax=Rosenbergiella collisarenosi TaxID=1544695 RepID=UPI001FD4B4E5|nr:helix-turn-helix domain-containing protein [Rosenbergiella collisarenosi]MBT0721810.1 helix-turn-helix transcriptional regulator [Rosenbergiella collisarenosi]
MDIIKSSRYHTYDRAACAVEATLELISGKGKGLILFYLANEPLRFNELEKRFYPISARTLTKQLRELEYFGLILREVSAETPPKVEYSLTMAGRSLKPLIDQLERWGNEHAITLITNARNQERG